MLVRGQEFFSHRKSKRKRCYQSNFRVMCYIQNNTCFFLFKWIRKSYQKMQIFTKLELELPMRVVALSQTEQKRTVKGKVRVSRPCSSLVRTASYCLTVEETPQPPEWIPPSVSIASLSRPTSAGQGSRDQKE